MASNFSNIAKSNALSSKLDTSPTKFLSGLATNRGTIQNSTQTPAWLTTLNSVSAQNKTNPSTTTQLTPAQFRATGGMSTPTGGITGLKAPTNQAVKSHTIKSDGTQIQTYHAPGESGASNTNDTPSTTASQWNPIPFNKNKPILPTDPYKSSISTQQDYATGPGNTNVNNAVNSNQNQTTNTPQLPAQKVLQNIATDGTPEFQQEKQNVKGLQQEQTEIANNPNLASEVASGRGQAMTGEINAAQTALQNTLAQQAQQITAGSDAGNLANTNQANQITAGSNAGQLGQNQQTEQINAANNAGSLTKPEAGATYFGNPVTGGLQGATQGNSSFTGNQLIDKSISSGLDIISRGGSTDDALASLVGGDVAKQAFITQMRKLDPNWTPTSSNAIAQQNMKQAQDTQTQAFNLDTGLKQLDVIKPAAINFLQQAGINANDIPYLNDTMNEYISKIENPANAKIAKGVMADIKKYTAQILGATGEINPTKIGEINDSFDPSSLSPRQLMSFLDALKTLGTNQLSVLQGQTNNSYGNTGGYMGQPANASSNIQPDKNSILSQAITDPTMKQLIGIGLNAEGGIMGAAGKVLGLASTVLK